MKFVVIIALSLASLSLAAPSTQPRQVPSGTSCSSPHPIEYGLDHLIDLDSAIGTIEEFVGETAIGPLPSSPHYY